MFLFKLFLNKKRFICFFLGHKMGRPICRDRVTGMDVDETLCDAASKPDSVVIDCNLHICPPK